MSYDADAAPTHSPAPRLARRVLIVGGVAGGASCAARLRRLDESMEIAMFDRGSYVAFANCGLPYYVGDVIADERRLLVASPEMFRKRFSIEVHTNTDVIGIDRAARTIVVRDQDGDLIDILVQPRRDARAACRFFRRSLKSQRQEPGRLVTDKLGSYRAAHRDLMPSVSHDTNRYANNRVEASHQPTRQRERQMRGFKSRGHAQRFLHLHGVIQNLFRVGRHHLRAVHHRLLRARAFTIWTAVTAG